MSITYEEALATLQSMFSAPWTRDLLDEVLRHEKGHMENTVDLILRHGDKSPQVLVDQLASGIDPQQSAVAADEALARQLSQANARALPRPKPSNNGSGKGKPTKLPDDFLRIPGVDPAQTSSLHDDEALARMLQDELFTEELRRNPDFAHLARGRSNAAMPAANQQNPTAVAAAAAEKINEFATRFAANAKTTMASMNQNLNGTAGTTGVNRAAATGVTASPNIMEKLSDMGDSAKRRLQLLAAQFNAQQDAGGSATSPTQRSEFRGLLDGDDDNDNMELAARKDL